jgi:hypothetical protein
MDSFTQRALKRDESPAKFLTYSLPPRPTSLGHHLRDMDGLMERN